MKINKFISGLMMFLLLISLAYGQTINTVEIIADDHGPSSDWFFAISLQSWVENYGGIDSSDIKKNSEITKDMLDNKVGIFIYKKIALIIIGKEASSQLTSFSTDVYEYLISLGEDEIKVCPTILNNQLMGDDFKDSLCDDFELEEEVEEEEEAPPEEEMPPEEGEEAVGGPCFVPGLRSSRCQAAVMMIDGIEKTYRGGMIGHTPLQGTYTIEIINIDSVNEKAEIRVNDETEDFFLNQPKIIAGTDFSITCIEEYEGIKKVILCFSELPETIDRLTCDGCWDENTKLCYPIGNRKEGLYCNIDREFKEQKSSEENCHNNYECSSNVCINNECISPNFIQKIINWFKRLFGG